jgi:hypothetical protein
VVIRPGPDRHLDEQTLGAANGPAALNLTEGGQAFDLDGVQAFDLDGVKRRKARASLHLRRRFE